MAPYRQATTTEETDVTDEPADDGAELWWEWSDSTTWRAEHEGSEDNG